MSYAALGQVWSARSFAAELLGSEKPDWVRGITVHHTAAPSLRTRPRGLTMVHMENLRDYYLDTKGWSSGPHLFADEDQIFGLTPLTEPGTHARPFNATHVGIEVLGDYDTEEPHYGRGFCAWSTCAAAVASMLTQWQLTLAQVNFHRDDPKTDKTCPGRKVSKEWFRDLLGLHLAGKSPIQPPHIEQTLGVSFVGVAGYVAGCGRAGVLTRNDEGTFLGTWRLETAFYDKVSQTTMAARSELEKWVNSTTPGGKP